LSVANPTEHPFTLAGLALYGTIMVLKIQKGISCGLVKLSLKNIF